MALLTKKEFLDKTGLKSNQISIYVGRGKVVLSGDRIDDAVEPNKSFIESRRDKAKDGGREIPVYHLATATEQNSPTERHSNSVTPEVGPSLTITDLNKLHKGVQIEKNKEEIQLLQIKKEKLQGILIPTEAVRLVFIRNSKGITTAFHQAADNLLVEFATLKKLSSKEVAEMRAKLIKVVNKAVEDGIKESKKEIGAIVSEYSETRGKGERK